MLLQRTVAVHWPAPHGWVVGTVPGRSLVGAEPDRLHRPPQPSTFEVLCPRGAAASHALTLRTYVTPRAAPVGSWVLVEAVGAVGGQQRTA